MNCKEFQDLLETRETLDLPKEAEAHSRECAGCRKQMDLHRRLADGFIVLRATCRPPDLAVAIREKIAAQGTPSVPWSERLMRLWETLAPTTPFKASVFYGLAGILIFALCWTIIDQAARRAVPRKVPSPETWVLSFVPGTVSSALETLVPGGSGSVPPGSAIDCGRDGRVSAHLPGRCELEARGSRLELLHDGFRLAAGSVRVKVTPSTAGPGNAPGGASPEGSAPFIGRTPFGTVTVLGTEYTLELTESQLTATVVSGRVRVEHPSGKERILSAGERLMAGPGGWIESPAATSTAPLNPGTDRPEVPED